MCSSKSENVHIALLARGLWEGVGVPVADTECDGDGDGLVDGVDEPKLPGSTTDLNDIANPSRVTELSVVNSMDTDAPGTVDEYGPGRGAVRFPDSTTAPAPPRLSCSVSKPVSVCKHRQLRRKDLHGMHGYERHHGAQSSHASAIHVHRKRRIPREHNILGTG